VRLIEQEPGIEAWVTPGPARCAEGWVLYPGEGPNQATASARSVTCESADGSPCLFWEGRADMGRRFAVRLGAHRRLGLLLSCTLAAIMVPVGLWYQGGRRGTPPADPGVIE
jgi:hypothetical protein